MSSSNSLLYNSFEDFIFIETGMGFEEFLEIADESGPHQTWRQTTRDNLRKAICLNDITRPEELIDNIALWSHMPGDKDRWSDIHNAWKVFLKDMPYGDLKRFRIRRSKIKISKKANNVFPDSAKSFDIKLI